MIYFIIIITIINCIYLIYIISIYIRIIIIIINIFCLIALVITIIIILPSSLNKEDSNSFNQKLSSFKFDDFKAKRLKKNNNNTNERKKMTIKFHHIPFIKTLNKEKEKDEKEKEEQNSNNENKNKNVDPTIKMLINPIKIVEKKSFKRKLFPVHAHIKLNKLNLLNNISNKNTNQKILMNSLMKLN